MRYLKQVIQHINSVLITRHLLRDKELMAVIRSVDEGREELLDESEVWD